MHCEPSLHGATPCLQLTPPNDYLVWQFYLWRDEPVGQWRSHCATFSSCASTRPYQDGESSVLFQRLSPAAGSTVNVLLTPKVAINSGSASDSKFGGHAHYDAHNMVFRNGIWGGRPQDGMLWVGAEFEQAVHIGNVTFYQDGASEAVLEYRTETGQWVVDRTYKKE